MRMTNFAKALTRLATRSARPDWTLAAIAGLIAAGIAESVQYVFG
jgi:hypothetical protein